MDSKANLVELDKLVGLFHADTSELGRFQSVSETEIPEPQRSLLAHDLHMTVTVEKFHSSPVDVEVLQERINGDCYVREIQLIRQSDRQVVQYGIVRLDFKFLDKQVQTEIQAKNKPLGRVLIDHNVLRRVQLLSLYKIEPTPKLRSRLNLAGPGICYGRTALIYCDDQPAVELLEIVAV